MPWAGGRFTRSNGTNSGGTVWQQDRDTGTKITAAAHDAHDLDLANGIDASINKDGSNAFTGNADLGSNKVTNVADATLSSDAPNVGQIQDGELIWAGTAGGTADALTLTLSPAITTYVTGMRIGFKASSSANTGAATVVVNGISGSKAIENNDAALSAGDIAANKYYELLYDGTAFQLTRLSASYLASISATSNGGAGVSGSAISVDPNNATDTAIAADDEILFADADDSNAVKKDTVQGILDLVASNPSILSFGNSSAQSQGTTVYYNHIGFNDATEANLQIPIPARTIKNLRVRVLDGGIGGSGDTAVATIYKNGSSTALTVTINTGSAIGSDTSNTVSFAADDRVTLQITYSAGTGGHRVYASVEAE